MWHLFTRELNRISRSRFFLLERMGLISLMFLLFFNYLPQKANSLLVGIEVFRNFGLMAFLLFLLFAPILACNLVLYEKQHGTLELMLLTSVAPRSIILSKYFSLVFLLFTHFLSILPLIMICTSFGTISATQVLALFAISLGVLLISVAIGLMVATISPTQHMQMLSVMLVMLWLALISLASLLAKNLPHPMLRGILSNLSPIFALENAFANKGLLFCFLGTLCSSFVAIPALIMASLSLSTIEIEEQPSKTIKKNPCPPISGNLVAWRDYYKVYGGKKSFRFKFYLCIILLAIFSGAYLVVPQFTFPSSHVIAVGCFIITFLLALFSLFSGCTHAFWRERQQKTLVFLLSTELSNWQVVWGKLLSIGKNASPFLILCFFSLLWSISIVPGAFSYPNFTYTFYHISNILATCSCAFFLSLHSASIARIAIYTLILFTTFHSMESYIIHNLPSAQAIYKAYLFWGGCYQLMALFFVVCTVWQLRLGKHFKEKLGEK